MLLRENWKRDRTKVALRWLRSENARGARIFGRPHGEHRLSLVEDFSSAIIVYILPRATKSVQLKCMRER